MNDSNLLKRLKAQILRACYYPYYVKRFREAGVDPLDIQSIKDFENLPLLTNKDVAETFDLDPPHGALYHPDTVWITHTPSPEIGLQAEYHTREDWAYSCRVNADHWRAAGVTEADIVQNASSFDLVVGGNYTQYTAVEMGPKLSELVPARVIGSFKL